MQKKYSKILPLHIHYDNHKSKIVCKFSVTSTILSPPHLLTIETVDCYIIGDLTFQAMSMGRESMAGYWWLLCLANRSQFLGDYPLWLMENLCCLGHEAAQDGKPKLFPAKFGKTKPGRQSLRREEGVSWPGLGARGSQAAVWAISGFTMVSLMLIKKYSGGLLGNKGFPGQFRQNKR